MKEKAEEGKFLVCNRACPSKCRVGLQITWHPLCLEESRMRDGVDHCEDRKDREQGTPQRVHTSESDIWTQILHPPLPGCVILGKSLNFSEPQISHLFFFITVFIYLFLFFLIEV